MNARLLIGGVLVMAMLLAAALAGSYLLSLRIISQRQQIWCPILSLSLSGENPAKLPPKQRADYYAIAQVSQRFGCTR